MLRKIRITAAAVFFTVITLLLLDFTGTLHAWFGWMAKVQLLPAVLAVNAGVVAALVLLTLLFGRVYCSVICPLGVFQDVVSRAAARRRKNRFRYSRALSWLRYGVLVLFLVAMVAHFKPVSNLLAPYSAYGRIVSNLFAPLYLWGNNLLAYLAERAGSYAFYTVDVWVKGAATLAVAAVTFIVLAVLAWRNGRTYCNTVCPVGTILGLVSRFAVFKPRIDASKCNGCGVHRRCDRFHGDGHRTVGQGGLDINIPDPGRDRHRGFEHGAGWRHHTHRHDIAVREDRRGINTDNGILGRTARNTRHADRNIQVTGRFPFEISGNCRRGLLRFAAAGAHVFLARKGQKRRCNSCNSVKSFHKLIFLIHPIVRCALSSTQI